MKDTYGARRMLPLGLLILLVGFPQISETIYTPALPNIMDSLHTTAEHVEKTLAIYFVGFALGVATWGAISDRYGRKVSLLGGLILYGIGTFFCGKSGSIEALLSWRALQAFGASVGSVITQTMIRDVYTGAERAKLFSVISGALSFSPALGPLLGGYVSEMFGWRANFWILAIVSSLLFLWSWISLPETRPQRLKNGYSFREMKSLFLVMAHSRLLWGHILLISATNGILFGFYQEAPFVFIEEMGIRPGQYGFFGCLIALATIAAARFSYKKSAYETPETLIVRGAWSTIIGAFFYILFSMILTNFSFQIVGFSCALFVIFFGIGCIIPNSLSIALKPYAQVSGSSGSIFGGLYYCFIAMLMWSMSLLHNGSIMVLPLYMAFLGIVLLLGSYMVSGRFGWERKRDLRLSSNQSSP